MLRSLLSPATFTLLTLTFLISLSVTPFVLAQNFRPQPKSSASYAYTEGQGLYVLGGTTEEIFMLDLSVSWNTSDPVIRELPKGPRVDGGACTMTNNGEDLFLYAKGRGHVYNVRSRTWRVFQNTNFWLPAREAITDPETGLIYLPSCDTRSNFALVTVDLNKNTINEAGALTFFPGHSTWSAYLKSLIVMDLERNLYMFSPSNGWSPLKLTSPLPAEYSPYCYAAAYNGTKLVYTGSVGYVNPVYSVFIMDLVKRTWTRGPAAPKIDFSSCAVTGDYFIVWGGETDSEPTNKTYVYNMKTEKWVSRYIAPPPRPTTTTPASQTPIQPITNAPESGNASSNDMKPVTIIVIVIGTLLVVILGLILYHRRTRQFNSGSQGTSPDGSSTDIMDVKVGDPKVSVKELSVGSSRRRDPSDSGTDITDSFGQRKWYMNGLPGRIHQGPFGARPLSEHPHAIVEDPTAKRNVQEGALEVQILSQHPHATVGEQLNPKHGNKALLGFTGGYGDKEELEDQ